MYIRSVMDTNQRYIIGHLQWCAKIFVQIVYSLFSKSEI